MTEKVWADLHKLYTAADWIDKPSIFAETAISYFPAGAKILDLGAGQGQDSRFFAEQGYDVTCTDIEQSALEQAQVKLPKCLKKSVHFQEVDLRQLLPFESESFDVVYAHLSLHYFDHKTTKSIFKEIQRVLKPGGVLAFFANSTDDPEWGTGKKLEDDYFQIDKTAKRYFSPESVRDFTRYFETQLLDNHGETYKDAAKGVHNLIRYIGVRPKHVRPTAAVACCGAIIERGQGEGTELLVQTRWQPDFDKTYSGTLEFAIGKLDVPYEDVHKTLAREIKEETGQILLSVKNDVRTTPVDSGKDDSIIGFKPYCCTQQLRGGRPWISFIFVCQVKPDVALMAQEGESKDLRWVKRSELEELYRKSPEKFFGLQLPAWEYYFQEKS